MGESNEAEIEVEQSYVSMLYGCLDALRQQADERRATTLRQVGGTMQARSERDAAVGRYNDQLARFSAVENGLCFGRLDLEAGDHTYIGRIGLFDTAGDHDPLLLDWRAPAARPFYLATAVSPEGVRRRRHIRTRLRTVVGLDDEVLDLAAAGAGGHDDLTGESALLGALTASRTGRMKDIVETIQTEQDRVIRSHPNGVLVVQGGPGTGKTAVALHRAAYLLYTYREQLETRGVLIVGPNVTFLRYISQVLPSLAETGVLLCTLGDLYPGVTARRLEPAATAELKGRAVMADVLARAVAERQWVPDEPIELAFEREPLVLDRWTCIEARTRARRTGRLHNLARGIFAENILAALAEQVAARIATDPYADDPLGGNDAPGEPLLMASADLADIRADLAAEPAVQSTLDRLWPIITPRQLLADLYADPELLAAAAPELNEDERLTLRRGRQDGWTPADVPLLDELAELLGEDETAARLRAAALLRARIEYAEGALEIVEGSRPLDIEDEVDPEILLATDLLDASALAERHEEAERLTTAQRAAADRSWAFGHIIVDEAQELSAMAWRLLMRRSPSRSMTLVGDVAQTGELAGATSWREVLEPYVADRWRCEELTVNYRTPAEIMRVAGCVLAAIDPSLSAPRSVRQTGVEPDLQRVDRAGIADAVRAEAGRLDGGRLGVIVPAARVDELGAAIAASVPDTAVGEDPELTSRVVVLTVRQAKGLEFDSVILVDPTAMLAESRRGRNDLYVALTRATQRLTILHHGELPAELTVLPGLSPVDNIDPAMAARR